MNSPPRLGVWIGVILAALTSAHAEAQSLPVPAPPDARFALAYYCNPTCTDDELGALDEALEAIETTDGFSDRVATPQRIMGLGGVDFGIPDAEFVAAYGVGVDQPESLAASQMVVLAWFAAPRAQAETTLATARAAFARLAEQGGGWVEDLDTQNLYGAEAWAQLDPRGPISHWYVIDEQGEESVTLVTRGLRRFGDFELTVSDLDPAVAPDVSWALNAVAESLHPLGDVGPTVNVDTPAARGVASLTPVAAPAEDPTAALLSVSFDGSVTVPVDEVPASAVVPGEHQPEAPTPGAPPAGAPQAGAATEAVAPASPAPVLPTPAPATLAEARRQVAERLAGPLFEHFQRGLAPGEVIAVSVPFRTRAGGSEYLWVEIDRWNAQGMGGRVATDPYDVSGLRRGDSVAVSPGEVYDYVYKRADGTKEGNLTRPFRQD